MRQLLIPLLCALGLAACDVTLSRDELDGELLLLHGEGRDGRVLMLSPATDSLVEVNRADKTVRRLPVGVNPRELSRAPGSDVLYTLEPEDGTLSRVALDGTVVTTELGGPFNRLFWAPDGTRAIAVFDPTLGNVDIGVLGSLNPNAIALLSDEGGVNVTPYTLTFPPLDVVFDPAGTKALISTSARLHVLDLETLEERAVPFTQQAGVERRPSIVTPSADGARALVAVQGQADLFVVSLEPVLIENVIAMPQVPTALAFSADGQTAVIASGSGVVSFLDLATFEADALTLSHGVNRILTGGTLEAPFALLYHDVLDYRAITRVELTAGQGAPDDPETYTLADSVRSVAIAPGQDAAVIFHDGSPGGSANLGVGAQSLSLFRFGERGPSRIFLAAPATDLLFLEAGVVPGSVDPQVIVVLSDTNRLVRYDLGTYAQVVLDTYEAPVQIGVLPAGNGAGQELFVVHEQATGLVSFVPVDAVEVPPGGWPAVAGFATDALLDRRSR